MQEIENFVLDYRLLSSASKLKKDGAVVTPTDGRSHSSVISSLQHLKNQTPYTTARGNIVQRNFAEVTLTRADERARLSFPVPLPDKEAYMREIRLFQCPELLMDSGVVVTEVGASKGRMVFYLADLPLNVKFQTDNCILVERISVTKVLVDDVSMSVLPIPEVERLSASDASSTPTGDLCCESHAPTRSGDETDPGPPDSTWRHYTTRLGDETDSGVDSDTGTERDRKEVMKAGLPRIPITPQPPAPGIFAYASPLNNNAATPLPPSSLVQASNPHSAALGFPIMMKIVGGGRCRITIVLDTKQLKLRRKNQVLAREKHGLYKALEDLKDEGQFTLIIAEHTYHFVAPTKQRRDDILTTIRFFNGNVRPQPIAD